MIPNKTNLNLNGGKVIASGGFGCIFKPAIKCKDQNRSTTDITKLMKKKYAKTEFRNIQKYKEMLKNVQNYRDYFLVDGFSTCEPEKLDAEDLETFDKKCSALKKNKMTSANVNENLNKLLALNMPYGGVDVGDYIELNKMDYKKLKTLNEALISLLKNGILQMNERAVYHCDVKDSNILVQEETPHQIKTRLIDWGLSNTIKEITNVPKRLTKRPIQFNVPFSVILFNDTFQKMHSEFMKKNKEPSYFATRAFVINYVITWINERGPGHLKSLNNIFKVLFEHGLINIEKQFKEDLIEFEYTFYFIFEYISQIVFKFTRNGKFEKMEYFSQVFLKNLDAWGFALSYLPILEYLEKYYDELCDCELELFEKIKDAILYTIECSCTPIDIDKLIEKFEVLNDLFLKANKKSTIHFDGNRRSPNTSESKSMPKSKPNSKTNSTPKSNSKSASKTSNKTSTKTSTSSVRKSKSTNNKTRRHTA